MRILVIGAIVLATWMGIGAYWHTCHIRMLCDECTDCPTKWEAGNAAEEELKEILKKPPIDTSKFWAVLGQDHEEIFRLKEVAILTRGESDIELRETAEPILDSIYAYLLQHPDHFVEVTGSFNPDLEHAKSGDTDLGLQRAEYFKQLLVDRGENPDRIVTKSSVDWLRFGPKGKHHGGLELVFGKLEGELEKEVEAHITEKTLYCEFAVTKFKPDPTLVNYTAELLNFLENNPGKKIHITGHTDDQGSAKVNQSVGLQRASQVRRYFVSQGIERSSIKIFSEGENAPVASNDTEEGRAQNRRIHVSVK